MIGLDSNILIRYFARDDPTQTHKADCVLESLSHRTPGYVPIVVLAELVWTMSSKYRAQRYRIIQIVEYLVGSTDLVVESLGTVKSALQLFTRTSGDFADCLIVQTANRAGCDHTLTFDQKAARSIGMKLVG